MGVPSLRKPSKLLRCRPSIKIRLQYKDITKLSRICKNAGRTQYGLVQLFLDDYIQRGFQPLVRQVSLKESRLISFDYPTLNKSYLTYYALKRNQKLAHACGYIIHYYLYTMDEQVLTEILKQCQDILMVLKPHLK